MPRRTVRPKSAQNTKSTPEARRLIRAVMRRRATRTVRSAAHALRLANHMQLVRMRDGSIRDTPEMKAALARADARAKRAWAGERLESSVDPLQLKAAVAELERAVKTLRLLIS